MLHDLALELVSRHYQTGKPGARYRLAVQCSCRTRLERQAVSPQTRWLTVTCASCGDVEHVDLRTAKDETVHQRKQGGSEQRYQKTTCTHRACGESFIFDFEIGDAERIHVVCPACGTIKRMRRALQTAALF